MSWFLARCVRLLAGALFIALATSCGGGGDNASTVPAAPLANRVHLASDAGDNMGQGQTYEYTRTNADINVWVDESLQNQHLWFEADGWDKWRGLMVLPAEAMPLRPGRFDVVSTVSVAPHTRVGIAPRSGAAGWDRSCPGATTGWVEVKSVAYASPGVLGSLSMEFELRCEGAASAVHGAIEWRGHEAPQIPGPIAPIPSGLWSPSAGATPAAGNYVYLESQPGDVVGGGHTNLFSGADIASMIVQGSGRTLRLSQFVPDQFREGEFTAMSSVTQLESGYYAGMRGQPAVWGPNQLLGGMYWRGPQGCPVPPGESGDQLSYETASLYEGWFAIDHIAFSNGSITEVDLRFEQRCVGSSAALHGKIHWVAP